MVLRQITLIYSIYIKMPTELQPIKDGNPQASPEEGGGNTEDHRASLMARVPIVVHITNNPAV